MTPDGNLWVGLRVALEIEALFLCLGYLAWRIM